MAGLLDPATGERDVPPDNRQTRLQRRQQIQRCSGKQWTMDPGHWIINNGSWKTNPKQWIKDNGSWIMNHGQWTMGNRSWSMDPKQ